MHHILATSALTLYLLAGIVYLPLHHRLRAPRDVRALVPLVLVWPVLAYLDCRYGDWR